MAPADADLKVCRIASLTLTNAMIFQQVLAERDARVESLSRAVKSPHIAESLLDTWTFIIEKIDYFPIFTTATEIMRDLVGVPDVDGALKRLGDSALRITSRRAALRHDLMGRIYHRLLADAKYFGAFYTTVPAATLLLKLTLDPGNGDVDWGDLDHIAKLRIADLACGTGTLLKASLQTIVENHVRARAEKGQLPDLKGVHKVLVEKVLWGLDVVPFAIHLAGSALALHEPDVEFGEMNLSTLPIGGPKNKLGSLELLAGGHELTVQADLFGPATAPAKLTGKGEIRDKIDIPQLDLCVMNPPFTRSVGGNLLFGHAAAKERERMQTALKKLVAKQGVPASITAGLGSVFVAAGHRRLNANGRMSLVLPRALLSGVAWSETRKLLGNNYHVKYIIVSHQDDYALDTQLGFC
jgi:N-6 DNA Methylase